MIFCSVLSIQHRTTHETCNVKQLKDMKHSSNVSHVLELVPTICQLKYHKHNIHNWG